MSFKYGYTLSTKTFATHRYHIELTDIGLRFFGSLVGLSDFGIADKYAKFSSTECGSRIH
jgi:hypothetical protein